MSDPRPRLSPEARYLVAVLALIGVFNLTDRTMFGVALPAIKQEFHLSDLALGLVGGTAFGIAYALTAVPIAWLTGRFAKRSVVAACLGLWSAATALTALATGFAGLFAARMVVGAGEAGGVPVGLALISARVPASLRGWAISLYTAGTFAGVVLGLWGTGIVIGHLGWRAAFLIFGLPGIALALLVRLTVREPAEPAIAGDARLARAVALWRHPALRHVLLNAIASAFVTDTIQGWTASYYAREFGLKPAATGLAMGTAIGLARLAGVLAAAWLGRAFPWCGRRSGLRMAMMAGAIQLPVQLLCYATGNLALSLAALFVAASLSAFTVPVGFTAVQNLSPAPLRALGAAIMGSLSLLVALGIGPAFAGLVSDLTRPAFGTHSLQAALLVVTALLPWPVYHRWRAARCYPDEV